MKKDEQNDILDDLWDAVNIDEFKDVVSLKHKGFKEGNCVVLGNEQEKSKSIPGYDIFEITKVDGTIQDIRAY